jgi:tRNA pseudouridine55 synthase
VTATPSPEPHGVLVVDKAQGPTSHDVVAVARRVLGTKAIGHTGTLDPMATGVLVLAVGEATKLVNLLGATDKRYEATVALGASTTSLDADGQVTAEAAVPPLELEGVRATAARFVGTLDQEVPAVSAVKVAGQALHKLARKGREVVAPVRQVVVHELEVRALREREIDLSVRCGKGFYVRSLARDLAAALGTLGHLSALRRTHNGVFTLEGSVDFERLRAAARGTEADRAELRGQLMPFEQVCRSLPHVVLTPEAVEHVRHGRTFELSLVQHGVELLGDEPAVALDAAGVPLALLTRSGDRARVSRGFRLS